VNAVSAVITEASVDFDSSAVGLADRLLRASADAQAALRGSDALVHIEGKLSAVGLTFRIGAPLARQRAPLEEDECPDARAVVERKFLDVENEAFVGTAHCFLLLRSGSNADFTEKFRLLHEKLALIHPHTKTGRMNSALPCGIFPPPSAKTGRMNSALPCFAESHSREINDDDSL
jgi:hypothetical protein